MSPRRRRSLAALALVAPLAGAAPRTTASGRRTSSHGPPTTRRRSPAYAELAALGERERLALLELGAGRRGERRPGRGAVGDAPRPRAGPGRPGRGPRGRAAARRAEPRPRRDRARAARRRWPLLAAVPARPGVGRCSSCSRSLAHAVLRLRGAPAAPGARSRLCSSSSASSPAFRPWPGSFARPTAAVVQRGAVALRGRLADGLRDRHAARGRGRAGPRDDRRVAAGRGQRRRPRLGRRGRRASARPGPGRVAGPRAPRVAFAVPRL